MRSTHGPHSDMKPHAHKVCELLTRNPFLHSILTPVLRARRGPGANGARKRGHARTRVEMRALRTRARTHARIHPVPSCSSPKGGPMEEFSVRLHRGGRPGGRRRSVMRRSNGARSACFLTAIFCPAAAGRVDFPHARRCHPMEEFSVRLHRGGRPGGRRRSVMRRSNGARSACFLTAIFCPAAAGRVDFPTPGGATSHFCLAPDVTWARGRGGWT